MWCVLGSRNVPNRARNTKVENVVFASIYDTLEGSALSGVTPFRGRKRVENAGARRRPAFLRFVSEIVLLGPPKCDQNPLPPLPPPGRGLGRLGAPPRVGRVVFLRMNTDDDP